MKNKKNLLAIGAAILSVGLFGAAAFALYEDQGPSAAPTTATSQPTAAPSPYLTPGAPAKGDESGRDLLGNVTQTAATYLGTSPQDLQVQLKAGKSLADVANATPGKSRDGLVAALTTAANANVDAAVLSGKLTAEGAAQLRQKLATQIPTIVDRSGSVKK